VTFPAFDQGKRTILPGMFMALTALSQRIEAARHTHP